AASRAARVAVRSSAPGDTADLATVSALRPRCEALPDRRACPSFFAPVRTCVSLLQESRRGASARYSPGTARASEDADSDIANEGGRRGGVHDHERRGFRPSRSLHVAAVRGARPLRVDAAAARYELRT